MTATCRRRSLILALFAFFVGLTYGQDAIPEVRRLLMLDLEADRVELDFGRKIVDAESEFLIDLDHFALVDDPAVLTLGLYDGVRLEAHRSRSRPYTATVIRPEGEEVVTWTTWTGKLYFPDIFGTDQPAGVIMLNDHGSHITGTIQVDATLDDFQIAGDSSGRHRLVRINRNRTQSCALQSEVALPISTAPADVIESQEAAEVHGMDPDPLLLAGDTIIRVLALVDHYDQSTVDFIQDSVSWANEIFDNSNIAATYEVVIMSMDIPVQEDIFAYIDWMNNAGRSAVEVRRKDWVVSADMVALFVEPPEVHRACGIANLRLWRDGVESVFDGTLPTLPWHDGEPAYSVHEKGCGLLDYTFAHELGHNMGLRHDITDLGETPQVWANYPPIDDHPRGYEFATIWGYRATAMGCWGETAPCYRTPYFSDPDLLWYGMQPTGNIDPDEPDPGHPWNADAVDALDDRVVEYSHLSWP